MIVRKPEQQAGALKDFQAGMGVKAIAKKWNVSRPTLNAWGITKKAQQALVTALIEEERVAGTAIEVVSAKLSHVSARKVKAEYRKAAREEAEGLKQRIKTYTQKVRKLTTQRVTKSGEITKRDITTEERAATYPGIFDLWSFVTQAIKKR